MKKMLFVFVALLGIKSYAQEIADHAIGLRFGANNGLGAALSYQHALSNSNRLEADFNWRNAKNYSAYKLTGIYQWVFALEGDFNWYAGAGAGVGNWSKEDSYTDNQEDGFYGIATGNLGIEYNPNIPFLFSLDFKPEIPLGSGYKNGIYTDIAIAVRYQF